MNKAEKKLANETQHLPQVDDALDTMVLVCFLELLFLDAAVLLPWN